MKITVYDLYGSDVIAAHLEKQLTQLEKDGRRLATPKLALHIKGALDVLEPILADQAQAGRCRDLRMTILARMKILDSSATGFVDVDAIKSVQQACGPLAEHVATDLDHHGCRHTQWYKAVKRVRRLLSIPASTIQPKKRP